jgi:hypothetical protein
VFHFDKIWILVMDDALSVEKKYQRRPGSDIISVGLPILVFFVAGRKRRPRNLINKTATMLKMTIGPKIASITGPLSVRPNSAADCPNKAPMAMKKPAHKNIASDTPAANLRTGRRVVPAAKDRGAINAGIKRPTTTGKKAFTPATSRALASLSADKPQYLPQRFITLQPTNLPAP